MKNVTTVIFCSATYLLLAALPSIFHHCYFKMLGVNSNEIIWRYGFINWVLGLFSGAFMVVFVVRWIRGRI